MSRSVHVLLDGRHLGKPYGFGRFADELCRALGQTPAPDVRVSVAVPSTLEELPPHPGLTWVRLPALDLVRWEQHLLPQVALRRGCSVLHTPYNTSPLRSRVPTVVTVHDLLFLEGRVPLSRLKDRVWTDYTRLVFRGVGRRAAQVVCVSDATRDALAAVGVPARTVHNTVDGFVADHPPRPRPERGRYALHRGGSQPHRNTQRVLDAFAQAAVPGVELLVLGVPDGAERFQVPPGLPVTFLPRVTDQELADLYAGAACVLATSLREGFGLPVLEAFGFGSPVITSTVAPLPEVAGDAALLVDPTDASAIAGALRSVLTDAALARRLVDAGRARAQVFSARSTAEAMLDVYRRVGGL